MKILNSIKKYGKLLLIGGVFLTSCSDYLDVVPPEQEKLSDATKDYEATLGFLYSCYGGVSSPITASGIEAASDEWVLPPLKPSNMRTILYGLNTPGSTVGYRWGDYYKYVGQCHLFLKELPKAKGVTDEEKKEFAAEANFLIAYYHMLTLIQYGPCPINDHFIPETADKSEFPGRYHFDYVTDWIVKKFDEAAEGLPANRADEKWGRATSTIVKAMKARLLLYAASPLWNGSFPYPQWKNTNFETPGYGKDLVSTTYDRAKWERAEKACQEALDFATTEGGNVLYTDENLYDIERLDLPFVPGVSADTPEGKAFLKKVMLMRYLVTTRVNEGNKEIVWGVADQGDIVPQSLPHAILRKKNGTYVNGGSSVSPVLNTSIEYFYTKNGKKPEDDPDFINKKEWFKTGGISGRPGIINLNVNREPRFYAWFAFDDGDYGSKLANGVPLRVELKDPEKNGFNPESFKKDNNATGYFSQKFIVPRFKYLKGGGPSDNESKPRPLIRLAELYLNLAECQAELGKTAEAISNINVIRERAGVPRLQQSDINAKNSIVDWVRNERFIELWGEGHRYYDIRRWMIAPKTMGQNKRLGLNAYGIKAPTFEEFNTVKPINQPFVWINRMYLLPIYNDEVYRNPQLVQAPGY